MTESFFTRPLYSVIPAEAGIQNGDFLLSMQ